MSLIYLVEQVLPEAHSCWVDANFDKEEPCTSNEVGKGLVGNDALRLLGQMNGTVAVCKQKS